jgi:hypothetical protein
MKALATLAVAAAVFVSSANSAEAAFQLRLTSGASVVTVTDGDALDQALAPGFITFIGSVGDYEFNLEIADTNSPDGVPLLGVASFNNDITGGGSLTIEVTDTGYTTGPELLALINGTALFGDLSFAAYVGATEFDRGDQIGTTQNFSGVGVSAFSGPNLTDTVGPYNSITIVVELSNATPGTTRFDAAVTAVPEPATLGLFGLALFGLGGAARRRFATR